METISVTIRINAALERTKKKGLCVHLNGSRVGDVYSDEV